MTKRRTWRAARIECECGFQGKALAVLRPRPSSRRTKICPACLTEVQRIITITRKEAYTGAVPME